jgi:hypothetical protein
MRNLTAYLMGDPGTHPRRNPTEQERQRLSPPCSHDWRARPVRDGVFSSWQIGEVRAFESAKKARSKLNQMWLKGWHGSYVQAGDVWIVTRRS